MEYEEQKKLYHIAMDRHETWAAREAAARSITDPCVIWSIVGSGATDWPIMQIVACGITDPHMLRRLAGQHHYWQLRDLVAACLRRLLAT